MSEELKPCPFCGGAASTSQDNTLTAWAAYCLDCQAEVVDFCTEDEAIAAWNRRAATPVPASTGREDFDGIVSRFFKNLPFTYRKRMLQVLLGWDDKVMEQVRTHSDERRCLKRALKVPPVAARELDVEAERSGEHPLWVEMQRLTRYRHSTSGMLAAPSGGFYSATDVQAMIAEFVAARSAAQSTAPAPAEAQMSIKRIAELAKQSEYEEPGHGRKTLDRIAFARAIEAEVAARFRAEGGNTKPEAGAGLGVKSAETRMDTGFDASAGFAPVSTEQAGDATFEYRTDAEDIWHKAPLAELEQIASDGFQVRAPSPNNSPVGGKDKA